MTPDSVLRQILAAVSTEDNWQQTIAPWLESSLGDGTCIPEKYVGLQPSLSDGTRIRVEYVDLKTLDMLNPRLSQPFIDGPQAKILVSSKGESLPVLAIFWRGADGQWRLRSFEFQCPACFGTGVLGYHPDCEICDSCGGSGWGAVIELGSGSITNAAKFSALNSARPCDPATVQWTRGRKTALSVAVVIVAMVVGFVLGLFVTRLVPGVPMGDGTYEGTVVSFFAFGFTFLVIVGVGGLLGVLYVWRVLE